MPLKIQRFRIVLAKKQKACHFSFLQILEGEGFLFTTYSSFFVHSIATKLHIVCAVCT